MKALWRQRWSLLAVILLVGALIVGVRAIERLTEAPDYSQIEDGLYLGAYVDAPPPGTNAVLNLCEIEDPYTAEVHSWQPIKDAAPAPSLDWLRQQVDFIQHQRAERRPVYVHCWAGRSRGALVVTAFLMVRHDWTRNEALRFLQKKRPVVHPNPAFMKLLTEWEHSLSQNPSSPPEPKHPQ